MMDILRFQEIGSIRKPRYLIDKYRGFLRGEYGYEDILPYVRGASLDTLRMLESAGLDLVFDGEMHRWEMYYHPIVNIDGVEIAGMVRVWDNYYFIKGRVVDRPRLRRDYHFEEAKYIVGNALKPVKFPVTGPYTLAEWSFNEYYTRIYGGYGRESRYEAKRALALELARNVINPILRRLDTLGLARIQIDEPAATTHPDEMDIVVEAFNEAVKGVAKELSIHICYSDYRLLIPYMDRFKTIQFTLEFANRDSWGLGISRDSRPGYQILEDLYEYGFDRELGLGVVDVHVDRVEPPELIRDRILYAAKFVDPTKLYVNPDCGLRTRSRDVAYQKLRNMVLGGMLARESLL